MSEKASEQDRGGDGRFEVFCGGSPSCGQLFPPIPGQPFVGVDGECSACGAPANGIPKLISALAAAARTELGVAPSNDFTGEDDKPPLPNPAFLLRLLQKNPEALAALTTAARFFSDGELREWQGDEALLIAHLGLTQLDEEQRFDVKKVLLDAIGAELQRRQHEAGVRPA